MLFPNPKEGTLGIVLGTLKICDFDGLLSFYSTMKLANILNLL